MIQRSPSTRYLRIPALFATCLLIFVGPHLHAQQIDYAAELPRLLPLAPQDAAHRFHVLDGFQVELVAAEPLIEDPIAFAFDARSRLFVVEMRGYSEQPELNLGRIALLTDEDHDGQMDRRTTFVDGLSWPTAVWPWRNGVLVAEPPRISWYQDTDDDGIADSSEVWLDGFHRTNVQGMVNSLRWGVDGFVHGATSSAGADLKTDVAQDVTLRRRDFRIDPVRKTFDIVAGGGQHGLSFNRWGDKFVTSNSDHLQQIIDLETWLRTHPSAVPMAPSRKSIAQDGPQAPVFRTSPVEPWRIVRTRLRVGGVVSGPVEGGGRAAGYFTGATGTWICDAEQGFGRDLESDTALVCDVGSNLIHRKTLINDGLFWSARRMDEAVELLTSDDIWFRPVQLGSGPDGAVYIADMYREVIEHPKSLPPEIKQHLDLTSGRDRGRIWRLKPTHAPSPAEVHIDMTQFSAAQLFAMLDSPIPWRRQMASQLLVENPSPVSARQVNDAWKTLKRPEARILLLHVAHRCQTLSSELIHSALKHEHARVVEHALHLSTAIPDLDVSKHWSRLVSLASKDQRLQLALAQVVEQVDADSQLGQLIVRVMESDHDPLVESVLAVVAAERRNVFQDPSLVRLDAARIERLLDLCIPEWIARSQSDRQLANWLAEQLLRPSRHRAAWLNSASRARQYVALMSAMTASLSARLESDILAMLDAEADDTERRQWLVLCTPATVKSRLSSLLSPSSDIEDQQYVMAILERSPHIPMADVVLDALPLANEELNRRAFRFIIDERSQALNLLERLHSERLLVEQVDAEQRARLLSHQDARIGARSVDVFGKPAESRKAVAQRFLESIQLSNASPSVTAGREHFRKACSQCHRLDEIGNDVGARLNQLSDKTVAQLVTAILNPNAEVDPRYIGYVALLDSDQTITGVIEAESSSQITFVESGGKRSTIPRNEIVKLHSGGMSLMPEGFESQFSPAQIQDLIAFLRAERKTP